MNDLVYIRGIYSRMNKHLKSFLIGAGSVVAVFPSTNYASFVPKGSSAERIRSYWEQTGQQLRYALKEYQDQQDAEKKITRK